MSQRGEYLNAEKEKLQLKHEENEFKEQIKLLRERLEHFDDPTDENSGKFRIFIIFQNLRHTGASQIGPFETRQFYSTLGIEGLFTFSRSVQG